MFFISLIAFFLLTIHPAYAESAYTVEELDRLEKGKIILNELPTEADCDLKAAEAKIYINSPPERVWFLLDDQENLDSIVPKIKDIMVLRKEFSSQKVRVNLTKFPLIPEFQYTLMLKETEKFRELKFKRIEGSFKELYGAWRVEPYNNGTILTYIMYIDFGFCLPGFLREFGLNKMLPETLEAIKAEAEKQKT